MKTAKDLELLLLVKEHEKQKLQLKISQAISKIELIINFGKEIDWNNPYLEDMLEGLKMFLQGSEDDEIRN